VSCGAGAITACCGVTSRDVERLLGGRRAAMAFTDPPYNVDLGRHGGQQRTSRRRLIANDALEPDAWEAFVRSWGRNLLAATDGAVYCAMSSKELPLVSRVLAEEGGHWSDTIIWAKDRFVLGRADYQRAYEPIWYGWREGATRHWCGDRDQGDVWSIARPAEAPLHPVMKPLALMERAIAWQPRGRARAGPVPRLWQHAHRGRADRAGVRRARARPPLLRRGARALGGVQRSGRSGSMADRWPAVSEPQAGCEPGTAPSARTWARDQPDACRVRRPARGVVGALPAGLPDEQDPGGAGSR
jgi:hypothetical protein